MRLHTRIWNGKCLRVVKSIILLYSHPQIHCHQENLPPSSGDQLTVTDWCDEWAICMWVECIMCVLVTYVFFIAHPMYILHVCAFVPSWLSIDTLSPSPTPGGPEPRPLGSAPHGTQCGPPSPPAITSWRGSGSHRLRVITIIIIIDSGDIMMMWICLSYFVLVADFVEDWGK